MTVKLSEIELIEAIEEYIQKHSDLVPIRGRMEIFSIEGSSIAVAYVLATCKRSNEV